MGVKMKDYYRILGILPSAEDVVIRAAYRALAQRYHPDKWRGNAAEAETRMKEINEAYGVLSDAKKRAIYDEQYQASPTSREYEEEQTDEGSEGDRTDWDVACDYYEDLRGLESELKKVSHRLAFHFRETLLGVKQFDKRTLIAKELERQFLEKYFGTNVEIIKFARCLITNNQRQASKELNRAMSVLGSSVDATRVINKVLVTHNLRYGSQREVLFSAVNLEELLGELRVSCSLKKARELVEAFGGTIGHSSTVIGGGFFEHTVNNYTLRIHEVVKKFSDLGELVEWCIKNLGIFALKQT